MRALTIGVVLVAVVAAAAPALAKGSRAGKYERAAVREAPVKDCTRVNGRYGYYGNPWCTPREQAAFDRWSDSRYR